MFTALVEGATGDLAEGGMGVLQGNVPNLVIALVGSMDGGSISYRIRVAGLPSYGNPRHKDMNSDSWLGHNIPDVPGLYFIPGPIRCDHLAPLTNGCGVAADYSVYVKGPPRFRKSLV